MGVADLFPVERQDTKRADRITIRRPDDWHIHLRDGAMLKAVLPYTAAQFARGIIMPNLVPPVTTVAAASAYRERILAALPAGMDFTPLMTCYLRDDTDPDEIERGFREKVWIAAKLYPAGATTNSHAGVTDLIGLSPVLERMERIGMPLLIHGEATDPEIDIFDREAAFMEGSLIPLLARHQGLKVTVEHATTAEILDVVREHRSRCAATITPHHLVINRTHIFQGGCARISTACRWPSASGIAWRLRKAATSGEACFYLGTDTAPHVRGAKEASCGCAGVFCGPSALQTYVQVFDEEGALDRFEAFASLNGARFHGLEPNAGTVTLERRESRIAEAVAVEETAVVVFRGEEALPWSVA